MKIGIIIIFHNNEKDIDTSVFIEQLNQTKNIELCFVNNSSKDNTYTLLNDINEACANVSLVNIKTFKSDVSAVRAGARYMFNKFNLKHIGYVTTNLLITKYDGLNGLINAINQNQDVIVSYNIETLKRKQIKLTLFKSLFSVIEYLKKIKVENQFINLQVLSKL